MTKYSMYNEILCSGKNKWTIKPLMVQMDFICYSWDETPIWTGQKVHDSKLDILCKSKDT